MDEHLRNSELFAANEDAQSLLDVVVNGPKVLSDSSGPAKVVVNGRRFDPTRDSLMRDGSKGYGVTSQSWEDGSNIVTFANGIEWTDKNGNTYFEVRDTSNTILSGKDYEQAGDRNYYLAHKYDPNSILDRALNVITQAMDNPERVLTDRERTEHEELTKILDYSRNHPLSPQAQNLIDIMDAPVTSGIMRMAGASDANVHGAVQISQALSGLAMTKAGMVEHYAFLNNIRPPQTSLLQPQSSSMVVSQPQGVRTDRIVVGANSAVPINPLLPQADAPLLLTYTPTTNTLAQIRNMPSPQRWQAGEQYVQELYGSAGQQHFEVPAGSFNGEKITGTGGRFVDAPVPTANGGVLANEVKTYKQWTTVGGQPTQQFVPLSPQIQQQVLKDSWLKTNVPGYDPRWIFLDAGPSPELGQYLSNKGITHVIHH